EGSGTHLFALRTQVTLAFSPLFIGEGSGTFRPFVIGQDVLDFQSPLHRGRLWNDNSYTHSCASSLAFSPLFIGEGSGTRDDSVKWPASSYFQSPLDRGRLWNK